MSDRPDEIAIQFAAHFFRQPANFLVQRPVAELQVMIDDEVLDLPHFKGYAHGDADGTDRQQLDNAFYADGPVRTDAFQRRQTHHLRTVEEEVPRAALAGI